MPPAQISQPCRLRRSRVLTTRRWGQKIERKKIARGLIFRRAARDSKPCRGPGGVPGGITCPPLKSASRVGSAGAVS